MRRLQVFNLTRLPLALRVILALDLTHERSPARYNHVTCARCHAFGLLADHAAMLSAAKLLFIARMQCQSAPCVRVFRPKMIKKRDLFGAFRRTLAAKRLVAKNRDIQVL